MTACAVDDDTLQSTKLDREKQSPPDNQKPTSKTLCSKITSSTEQPWLGKIDSTLICAKIKSEKAGVSFENQAKAMSIITNQAGVILDVVLNSPINQKTFTQKLHSLEATIQFISVQYHRATLGIHHASSLYSLARMPEVRSIKPEYGGSTLSDLNIIRPKHTQTPHPHILRR